GLTEVEEKWVAVSEIVNRSLTFVEFRAQARGIKFDLDAIDDGFEVWADERMMVQALSNLLSNAVKFSHHGGLVEIITAIMPDGRFEIRVEDRGIGVDAGDIENVFEPFWQAKSPLRSADEGIGLGLSIVRQLMDLHGGEVAMRVRDDGGTAVCLLLPKDRARKRSDGAK
ncbi:MAG: ATP-binding protein, partial [Pseudomonadota bacterium]|nr:ATP-binding protein [Pseudomonadota bacterium]